MVSEEKEKKEISLRSEEVQEILGCPPRKIIRYGISIIITIVLGIFVGSYFFKYPDTIPASISISTENLPVHILAKVNGRIDSLFVAEDQKIAKEEVLALLSNPASYPDVLFVKNWLAQLNKKDSLLKSMERKKLALGDIQPAFASFVQAYEDYRYFIHTNYHKQKTQVIQKQILAQKKIRKKLLSQSVISSQQMENAKDLFAMDSQLFEKGTISSFDIKNASNHYLQQRQSYESNLLNIDNLDVNILQLKQSLFDLDQQNSEQRKVLKTNLTNSQGQLESAIKRWEETYLFKSPVDGIVSTPKFWQSFQNINAGEILMTIVPEKEHKIIGKIILPSKGAGKVKKGQYVNVKLDDYPYMEFGILRVIIHNISLVPISINETKAYILEVHFPNQLKTTYGKNLVFKQEMQGTAEIITEDLRLLDRFLNPIRALLKK